MKAILALWVVWVAFYLACLVALFCVAWHFIAKAW